MGFSRAAGINQSLNVRRKSMVIVITMIFLISVPLGVTGYNFVVNNMVTENVQEASTTWLNGSDYKVSSVNAENSNNQVVLVVIGNGNLPPLEKLNNMLQGKLYGKTLQVEVVYSNSYTLGK